MAYAKARDAYRKANMTTPVESSDPVYLQTYKEFLEARVALQDAVAKAPVEARAKYNETRIAAEVDYQKARSAAAQIQKETLTAANAAYQEAKAGADTRRTSTLDATHLKAGKAAYAIYWETIHRAYFAYQDALVPADANRLVAESKAKDKWKDTYIHIYKNPNIGLVREVSGQSEERLLELAEAERQKCPY